MAVKIARRAETAGADGILLLPHYLIGASQARLAVQIQTVCDAFDIGVIVYNRGNSIWPNSLKARPDPIDGTDGHPG